MKILKPKKLRDQCYNQEDTVFHKLLKNKGFKITLLISLLNLLMPSMSFMVLQYNKASEKKKSATQIEIAVAEAFTDLGADTIKEWIKGPVRYISSYKDEAEYKRLKTAEERLNFIYHFWLRRDPTPWTLKNELRLQFWERVQTANALFARTTKSGWRTDRGKIFILLGPPDDIEKFSKIDYAYMGENQEAFSDDSEDTEETGSGRHKHPFRDTRESGHRGLERWIYNRGEEFKIDPYLVVPFYIDDSGDYRLSGNPEHYAKATPYLSIPSWTLPDPSGQLAEARRLERSKAFTQMTQVKFDIGQAIDIASGEKVLEEIVETLEFFEPFKGKPEFRYFPSEDNKDYVLLSVDLSLSDFYKGEILDGNIIPIALFGKAISLDGKSEYMFSSDDYAPRHIVREGKKVSIMASFYAPPGKYNISGGIQEMVSGNILNFQNEVVVPNIENCEMGVSNYILAKSIKEKLTELNPLPFGMNVLPKVDNEFHKNEDFGIYYQVCGLGINEETGRKNYDVSYQFYKNDKNNLIKLGKPIISKGKYQAEQGWSFPLSKWPAGEYVLEMEIHDNVKSERAVYSIDFKVMD
jgi:GWxTD domain-containing protein